MGSLVRLESSGIVGSDLVASGTLRRSAVIVARNHAGERFQMLSII